MTANELVNRCGILQSTLYRSLDVLGLAALLRERDKTNPSGGQTTYCKRAFDDVLISVEETGVFSVTVEYGSQTTDERIADIWLMIEDEL
ncbi:ArsR family transcriptional regulator [Halogeometricum luteum]|jgi:predicted transcriptional regulator|uniref:ArsR family transcriptional regulator n=1 Tax=Halogeometricum luteum TaxID=2950537 RepID=A0ABU2G856_9EURY|nr:ArsR family transcriptional regulator [Halogeometricum sp. S3BR5-2]MDS0296616.1 ArsR family transcriptional regulator [Halogeometricum sp. S3BR5-2]